MSADQSMDRGVLNLIDLRVAGWALAGIGLLVGFALLGGLEVVPLMFALGQVPLWVYAATVVLQAAIIVIASTKWVLLLTTLSQGQKVMPLRDAIAASTMGAAAGQILPIQIVTPLIRAWIAHRFQIATMRAIATSIFEQLFEIIVLVAMGLIGVGLLILNVSFATSAVVALIAMVALTSLIRPCLRRIQRLLDSKVSNLPIDFIQRMALSLSNAARQAYGLPFNVLAQLTSYSLFKYALMAGLNILILNFIVPDVDMLVLLAAYPLILFVISVPLVPGGLGVVEATWSGILTTQGVPLPDAVEAAFALRIISTLGFLLIAPFLIMMLTPKTETAG